MDSFDYFQISILGLLYLISAGRIFQLWLRGVNVVALGAGKKGLKRIGDISIVLVIIIWTVEIVSHSLRIDFRILPEPACMNLFHSYPLKLIGVVLITIGFLIWISALAVLGRSWRVGIDGRNPGNLVTNGIYSLSRNPIYLFFLLYCLGTWLIYANGFFLMFLIIEVVSVHFTILKEEKYLKEQYEQEYEEYAKKVRRYL